MSLLSASPLSPSPSPSSPVGHCAGPGQAKPCSRAHHIRPPPTSPSLPLTWPLKVVMVCLLTFSFSDCQWLRDAQHFHPRLESLYPALWETCEEFGESYPFQTLKSMVSLSTLNTSFSGLPLIENSFWGWRLPWATCKREAKKLWWRLRRKVIVFLNSGKQDKEDRNLSKYNQTTASKYCQSRSFIISTQVKKKLKKIMT